jgi:pimeloyl-ACP methyl ester carboxylesterase
LGVAKAANQIRLRDGRWLGFFEAGDLQGEPIFYFHGFPGSRLEVKLAHKAGAQMHARIIGVDRPGYGLSDPRRGRKIGDWPNDVIELADALGIDRFAVLGASGGGPYAAACALKIPQRLTAVGIACGVGPIDAPHATEGMIKINRMGLHLAGKAPRLATLIFILVAVGLRFCPKRILGHIASKLSEPDRRALQEENLKRILSDSFRESVRSGHSGPTSDLVLYANPWAFRLQEISIQVHLWHGEKDNIIPPSMGRYLAETIPDCKATFYPEEGHFSLVVHHMTEFLHSLRRGGL